jgi:hypothetical protein
MSAIYGPPAECKRLLHSCLYYTRREKNEHTCSGFYDVGRIWFDSGGLFAFNGHGCNGHEPIMSGDWYSAAGMLCMVLKIQYQI